MDTNGESGLSRIVREPLSAEVVRRLTDYLLSSGMKPGERIPPERRLAEMLGVGRSTVREAIKPLQLMGILEVRVGDGTYLAEADSSLLPKVIEWGFSMQKPRTRDVKDAIVCLETGLAGLAAAHRDAEDIERMRNSLEAMAAARDERTFQAADMQFHADIAAAARNDVLSSIIDTLWSVHAAYITVSVRSYSNREELYVGHLPVFEAIESGDPAAAEARMKSHLHAVLAHTEQALGARTSSEASGTPPQVQPEIA